MGKSQNRCSLFVIGFCLVILGLMTAAEAQSPAVASTECPANENYLPCGPSCQTECRTLRQPCLINHIRCPDGCYCKEGYARNDNKKCIPISQCPKN